MRSVESLTPEQLKDEVAHFENGKVSNVLFILSIIVLLYILG